MRGDNIQRRGDARGKGETSCGKVPSGVHHPPPLDLVSGCLCVLQRILSASTKHKNWNTHKVSLIHYLHTHLPHHLLQRLLDRVLCDWRVYDTVTLRMLELIFSSTTSSLQLIHVRTFYRDAFINLLPTLTGLQQLKIQDPVWTFSRRQLGVTLLAISKMSSLRILTLQYCGHDVILAAAGANCPHLQVVDMRGARGVTDAGVWSLVTGCPYGGEDDEANFGSFILDDQLALQKKKKRALRFGNCWGLALKSMTSKLFYNLNDTKDTQEENSTPSVHDYEDIFSLSDCSYSLVHVDLRCTKVTAVGVAILQQSLSPKATIVSDSFRKDNNG